MIIDKIIEHGLVELSKQEKSSYRIDNIILGTSFYTMKDCKRVFNDMNMCLIILEQGYGFAYFQDELNFQSLQNYVNKDLREVLKMSIPFYLKVAIADAIYSVANNLSNRYRYKYFKGDLRTKARSRATELVDGIPEGSKVLLLGAVTEIINECTKRGLEVSVLDLDHSKIGLILDQKKIEDSRRFFTEEIKQVDYVITTGMIFVSETADSIFEAAKQNGCKLIMYMETGSNFGEELLKYGAYKVLSEFFPYYDFFGDTKYIIFEKSTK